MSRSVSTRAILSCASSALAMLLPLAPRAHAADKIIIGEFIGCGMGQGITECRILGDEGKDSCIDYDEAVRVKKKERA